MRKVILVSTLLGATLALSCTGALTGGTFGTPASAPVALRAVAVVVQDPQHHPVVGAVCGLDAGPVFRTDHGNASNGDGYIFFGAVPAIVRHLTLVCSAPGYQPFAEDRALTTAGNEDLAVAILTPIWSSGGESGALHVDGVLMRGPDGAAVRWRGCTDFLLLLRFINGDDLKALLEDRITAGCRTLRVLGMVDSFAHLYPQEHADYVAKLVALADLLASRGLRLEFVVFADAQIIMPDVAQERAHVEAVVAALVGRPLVVVEVSNEPFKNLPGGDEAAAKLAATVRGRGVLVASGAYTAWPPLPTADYGTTHADRKDDWPRTGKDLFDLSEVTHTPWISDEPMGASETDQPGKRSAVPPDFAWFAATTTMFGPGATFHSDAGIVSQPFGPVQRACAQAFFWGLNWVPADAPLWPYQRGDSGSEAGFGNMPILHDDALELRSFCKGTATDEYCVQIRTTRAHATARDGWRILEEPRKGFVHLVKP